MAQPRSKTKRSSSGSSDFSPGFSPQSSLHPGFSPRSSTLPKGLPRMAPKVRTDRRRLVLNMVVAVSVIAALAMIGQTPAVRRSIKAVARSVEAALSR